MEDTPPDITTASIVDDVVNSKPIDGTPASMSIPILPPDQLPTSPLGPLRMSSLRSTPAATLRTEDDAWGNMAYSAFESGAGLGAAGSSSDSDVDSEDDPLAGSVRGDYEEDMAHALSIQSDHDDDIRMGNTAEDDSGLAKKASHYYQNYSQTAELIGLPVNEFRNFLLHNDDFNEVSEYRQEHCTDVELKAAKDSGKGSRQHLFNMDTVVERIQTPDAMDSNLYLAPTRFQKNNYQLIDHWCHSTYRTHEIMRQAGFHRPSQTKKTKLRYAFIVLKCREVIDSSPRKKQQLLNAHKSATILSANRRADQLKRRAKKAFEAAVSGAAHDGELPQTQSLSMGPQKMSSSKAPKAPRVRNRKQSHLKPESALSDVGFGSNTDDDDNDDVTNNAIVGTQRRSDRAYATMLARQQQQDANVSSGDAVIDPKTSDVLDILVVLEKQAARAAKLDVKENARRQLSAKLAALTLEDHIADLGSDHDRLSAYNIINSMLRASIEDYFDDFRYVDVQGPRDLCLEAFPMKKKPTATFLLENAISLTNQAERGSSEHDSKNPENILPIDSRPDTTETIGNLSSMWSGEEVRTFHQADVDAAISDSTPSGAMSAPRASMDVTPIDDDDAPETDPLVDASLKDLPPAEQLYKDLAQQWSKLINGQEYQDERLKAAMIRCYIGDANRMRVPGQSAKFDLRWWQVICVFWCDMVHKRFGDNTTHMGHSGWTKGGLIADAIGLGKTLEYGAWVLVNVKETVDAYNAAPDKHKPSCRPLLILTLPSLVTQTTEELRKLSPLLYLIVFHGASPIKNSANTIKLGKLPNDYWTWNPKDERNNRTVIISSYDTFCGQYGPQSQNKWHKRRNAYFKPPPPGKQPLPDKQCPTHPYGRVRGLIADEPQVGCRNESSYWTTIKWLDADQVWLFSGSPAPRGLEDVASYLGLVEHTDVAADARRAHYLPGCQKKWTPDTDPYELPDDDPRCKFRFTKFCFMEHVARAKALEEYEQGEKARKIMPLFILRRDYQSECPFDSGNRIAANLPDLTHFSLERTFMPTARQLYDAGAEDWQSRLVIHDKDPLTGEMKRMPNPRAFRAVAVQCWYPYTRWLHVKNPHYIPPPKGEDGSWVPIDPNASFDREHEIDWYSWFMDQSAHYKSMPPVGSNLRQHRWILTRAAFLRSKIEPSAPVDIPCQDYTAKGTRSKRKQTAEGDSEPKVRREYIVPNAAILRMIMKWSPKVAAILALIVKHVILQSEKVIIWFTYRTTLDLFREIMLVLPYFLDTAQGRWNTLTADTPHSERHSIQEALNDHDHPLKVLLASNKVGAIGVNFHKGCSKQIHGDTAETYDTELQAIGRCYRLGQLVDVVIYSFMISGTMDSIMVEKMLTRALAGTVAMMEHKSAPSVSGALNVPLDDHMSGYFLLHSIDESVSQILHVNTLQGTNAIESMRQRMRDSGKHTEDPSVCEKWLPTFLAPGEATKLLMRASRANTVIQHGGIGTRARQDLGQMITQEILARDEHEGTSLKEDPAKVDAQPHDSGDKSALYDPDADPDFLSGIIKVSAEDYKSMLPTQKAHVKLEAPRLGADGKAWMPTTAEWANMDSPTRARVRREVETSRDARMQFGTSWKVPEADLEPKAKKKRTPKAKPAEEEEVDSDADPTATRKRTRRSRRDTAVKPIPKGKPLAKPTLGKEPFAKQALKSKDKSYEAGEAKKEIAKGNPRRSQSDELETTVGFRAYSGMPSAFQLLGDLDNVDDATSGLGTKRPLKSSEHGTQVGEDSNLKETNVKDSGGHDGKTDNSVRKAAKAPSADGSSTGRDPAPRRSSSHTTGRRA